ncbi:MAG: dephospho-CoA kinase, partial [Alkalibacterium sp.]|nr:dephospho-CoA kinase [Alkalibacterium sp.]
TIVHIVKSDKEGIIIVMILGLTGGISSGKSTVSHYLRERGFPVIDADIIARKVMEPEEPAYLKVIDYFGSEILDVNNVINRKKLGDIVFSESEKLNVLNKLVQKEIFNEIMRQKDELCDHKAPMIVLDIPLLYEAGYHNSVDKVMVVYVDEGTQLKRLKKRDALSETAAIQRIKTQMPLIEKKERADIVIDNNGTLDQTRKQIDTWLNKNSLSSQL